MTQDHWDSRHDRLPSSDADAPVANAASPSTKNAQPENVQASSQGGDCTQEADQRNTTGGAVQPNNAQELAEDIVEQASLESFPASDPPAW